MSSPPEFNCLITGAGGFIGQALAAALLASPNIASLTLTDLTAPLIPHPRNIPPTTTPPSVSSIPFDLTHSPYPPHFIPATTNLVYLLHGIMSSASESNLPLSLSINLDATRSLLDHLRTHNPGCRVIYTSTTAVYGPPPSPSHLTTERDAPNPQGTYGAHKLMCETLLDDYSRRGLLDGRSCRLPTVTVRPGKPTGAASSFASGIIREPLQGRRAVLPVGRETEIWICSPRTVVRNLVHASVVGGEGWGESRVVNLPGGTVRVEEMLGGLGEGERGLVVEERDEEVERIVGSWPVRFDTGRARGLGFVGEEGGWGGVREFVEDYLSGVGGVGKGGGD